jgi:tetratricopeptide (TPR) repeat protein
MSNATDENLLMELLLRWDESRRQGRDASPDELCGGHPELAAELERRIRALEALEAPLGDRGAITSVVPSPTPSRSDGDGTCRPVPTATVPTGSRYRRLQFHARGGLGELFVAHDEELNRQVALKEIQDTQARDPISRSRFLFEAQVTAGLEHPGIVPVHGLGHYADGRPYYAMRLIRGESLKEAIGRLHAAESAAIAPGERARTSRQLLRRLLDVCDAVAYAHSRGIIHRDLKPSNIMLGPYGETLVVDWGLAKRLGRSDTDVSMSDEDGLPGPRAVEGTLATQPGGVSGTPAYMSPEQAGGEVDRLGPASDIYSLGATLYCLLTGRAPFEADNALTILERVRKGEFPSPRSLRPDIPRSLEAVCRKAIALRPEDRYTSVQDLSDDLEKWLAGEAVSAYREPWIDRVRRWLSRHRTLVAATGVGIGIALMSLGGIVILLSGANRRLSDANRREHELRADAVAARDRAERAQEQAVTERDRAERAQGRAVAEADRAREEARKATMLSDFLVRLFQSSDPLGLEGQGFREPTEAVKELTAVHLLRRGADRIEGFTRSGSGDAATVAVLMDAIGNSLRSLGDIEHARPLLEGALRMRRGSARVGASELADSLFHLGILDHDSREIEAAEARYRDAIRLYQQADSGNSLAALRVEFRLAWLLAEAKRTGEAEALFREVLQDRRARLGADHPDVQVVQLALLVVLLDRGDRRALLAQAPEFLGRNSLPLNTVLAYLRAMAQRQAHLYPAARRQYEEVLSTARKFLPAQHPILAMLLGDMAGLYREIGDLRRAEEVIREALEIGRRTIPLHPWMIEGLTSYADEMVRQGRIEEAERLYLEAIDVGRRRNRINPSDDRWKGTLDRLVRMEEDRGRTAKAGEYRKLLGREGHSEMGSPPSGR